MKNKYLSWVHSDLAAPSRTSGTRAYLDANAELVYSFQAGRVTAYSLSTSDPSTVGTMMWTARSPPGLADPLRGCVALSLPVAVPSVDGAVQRRSVLAILQGNDVVHLLDVTTGQSFIQAVPPPCGRLLGFMWTSCANAQFVIVTSLGIKCFTLGKQALHTSKASKALEEVANTELGDVLWYKYQHHSRILILATQFDLVVLQITGQRGITRLKRFNLSKIYGSVAAIGSAGPECFSIVRSHTDVPGGNGTRIYICVVHAARQAVHVLSLSAAEVTYIGDLAWPSSPDGQPLEKDLLEGDMRFSVFDNLVVMHCLPLGTAAIYDFLLPPELPSDGSNLPLFEPVLLVGAAAPMSSVDTSAAPLLAEPAPAAGDTTRSPAPADIDAEVGDVAEGEVVAGAEAGAPAAAGASTSGLAVSSSNRTEDEAPPATAVFIPPCHAVDVGAQRVYRLQVDLKACLSDTKVRGANRFLCLCERSARLWPWLQGQQIRSLRDFLLTERDLAYVRRVFDSINARFKGHALRAGSVNDLTVLLPADVVEQVLQWLHQQDSVEDVFVEALVSLFGLSARACSIQLPPSYDTLLLSCIASQGKGLQAGLVMRGMNSVWARPAVIHELETKASSGILRNMHTFCARLWSRVLVSHNATGTHRIPSTGGSSPDVKAEAVDGYVRCLLQDGDIKGAAAGLRDVLGAKREQAAQLVVQEAASGDPLLLAAARRCCSLPGALPLS